MCKTNGKCENDDSCQVYDGNTMCADPSCSGNELTAAKFCNGMGKCDQGGIVTDCSPFNCNPGTMMCYGPTCGNDTECASPNVCDVLNMSCGPMM